MNCKYLGRRITLVVKKNESKEKKAFQNSNSYFWQYRWNPLLSQPHKPPLLEDVLLIV
jgi:hypothetical protein